MPSWALILHFYQPPSQSLTLTELILRSSYLPFLDLLLTHPEIQMTLNISASLLLQLEQIKDHDFFEKFCHSKPVPGFFPPELAVDEKVLRLISKQMDFTIIDESSLNPNFDLKEIPKSSPSPTPRSSATTIQNALIFSAAFLKAGDFASSRPPPPLKISNLKSQVSNLPLSLLLGKPPVRRLKRGCPSF